MHQVVTALRYSADSDCSLNFNVYFYTIKPETKNNHF